MMISIELHPDQIHDIIVAELQDVLLREEFVSNEEYEACKTLLKYFLLETEAIAWIEGNVK